VQEKVPGGHMAWLLARYERDWPFTLLLPAVETATSLPSGMLLAQRMRVRPLSAARAATVGALFGLLIERGQLRLFSHAGQGKSVTT
jgi:hypothetical protein